GSIRVYALGGQRLLRDLKRSQTTAYFLAFIGLGLAIASLGPTLPGLASQVRVSIADISYLFTLRSFGFLLGSLLSGRFYDSLRGHSVMAAMVFSMSATLALLPLASTLKILLVVMFILGTAEGALGVGGNALLVWVHQGRVGPFMNALHFFYGVGAVLSPLVIRQALKIGDSTTAAYLALAILVLPPAAWLLWLPSPRSPAAHDASADAKGINYKVVALVALLLCLYLDA